MSCRTNASDYDGVGAYLQATIKTVREENEWTLNAVRSLKEAFIQWQNNSDEAETIEYEIKLVDQSLQKLSGSIQVPPRTIVAIYFEFANTEIAEFDYLLHDQTGDKRINWCLGGYHFSRTIRTKGIASGKVIAIYDNNDHEEHRTIEYNLLDEKLMLVMNATNPTNTKYRLRLVNSFLFAENFNLDEINDLVEICVLPQDIYKIEVIIKPSGEIDVNSRRL